MLTTTCHCSAVKIQIPREPEFLAQCNCSICRRYGVLWAYYKSDEVVVEADPGATEEYVWGRRVLSFVRCKTCGCITHWKRVAAVPGSKMGVNARNFDPVQLGSPALKFLDGASG